MDLENLNNEYLRLQAATGKYKTNLTKYEADLEKATQDKENAKNNLQSATTPADKKKYQKDLNDAITEIQDIKIQIEIAKKMQEKNKQDIEKIINDVKELPEVKAQCSRAIDIKTERQIKKFEKQKKEQEDKKTTLVQLKNMIEKHPQATMIVNNIENQSFEISKKDSEIKDVDKKLSELEPTDPNYATDKARLDAEKMQLEGERSVLINDRQAERNNLKKLFNNQKLNEEIDNLSTRVALDKGIKNCDRLIKRSENKVHDYTYAKNSLYNATPVQTTPAQPAPTQPTPQTQPVATSKWEKFKSIFKKREAGDPSRWETFKSIFKKQSALPAPSTPPTPPVTSTPTTPRSFKDEIRLDNDIMKNEVVQAIVKETFDKKVEEGKNER